MSLLSIENSLLFQLQQKQSFMMLLLKSTLLKNEELNFATD